MIFINQASDSIFMGLEFLYFLLALVYILSPLRFLLFILYPLAGIKFAFSSLFFFDTRNYEKVYDLADKVSLDPVMDQEGAFVSLLYLFKSANLPLVVLHGVEIIAFLFAAKFLFEAFLPSYQAIVMSLLLGLFATMGEMGLYLLRQLLSTTLVFMAMGFLFREKKGWAFFFLVISFFFHSSSFVYIPLFLTIFTPTRVGKILVILVSYSILFLVAYKSDFGVSVLNMFTGQDSLYTSKYDQYSEMQGVEGWRETALGAPLLSLIVYFVGLNAWKNFHFWRSPYWLYYVFSLVLTGFYLVLGFNKIFWLSSRFNFMSNIFLLTACVLLSLETLSPKEHKPLLMIIFSILLPLSLRNIMMNYDQNVLFRLPF